MDASSPPHQQRQRRGALARRRKTWPGQKKGVRRGGSAADGAKRRHKCQESQEPEQRQARRQAEQAQVSKGGDQCQEIWGKKEKKRGYGELLLRRNRRAALGAILLLTHGSSLACTPSFRLVLPLAPPNGQRVGVSGPATGVCGCQGLGELGDAPPAPAWVRASHAGWRGAG